jgi:hypothetical protein
VRKCSERHNPGIIDVRFRESVNKIIALTKLLMAYLTLFRLHMTYRDYDNLDIESNRNQG